MSSSSPDQLRLLPSIDALLQDVTVRDLVHRYGRDLVVGVCRDTVDTARREVLAGAEAPMPALVIDGILERLNRLIYPRLTRVLNATGVILHTNLGRAPLSAETLQAMQNAAAGYSNLEYDLDLGARGSRYDHAQDLLVRLTGAEAALVVNNNAAALMFLLTAFARERHVLISRGELVEIGGGFRIPDVMAQSGARLVEVGTTNRTYAQDYRRAITAETALLMRVHHSNFRMIGFTHAPSLAELAGLAHEKGLLLVDDLGSGALLDTRPFGLEHEPLPSESLTAGADLVCFSGDKLLGGPQGGIIVGKQLLLDVLKKHPLARALRVDKVTLAGLQATLLHYLKSEALVKVPVWKMIALAGAELDSRASSWAARWRAAGLAAESVDALSTIGGGSLPGETLPTRCVALAVPNPDDFAAKLRRNFPPIVARIEGGRLLFDPRTVLPGDEELLLAGVERAAKLWDNPSL